MPRPMSAAMITALQATNLRPLIFYQAEFRDGVIGRWWAGVGPRTWNGYTWTGDNGFIGMTEIEETNEIRATAVEVTASAVSAADRSRVLQSLQRGRPGILWIGLEDTNGAVISDPVICAQGRFSNASMTDSVETSVVKLQYEGALARLETALGLRYTPAAQKAIDPNDTAFRYTPTIEQGEINWGRGIKSPPFNTSGHIFGDQGPSFLG